MPTIRQMQRLARDQQGGVAIAYAMFAILLCGFAALAVDAGQLYAVQTRLQGTATAAALAGVQDLPNPGKARQKARLYAEKNMPVADYGEVLKMADIVVGEWDEGTRSFSAGGSTPNAVHVVTRRARSNGNAAPTSFASLMGFAEVDVTAEALAIAASPPICFLALNPTASGAFDVGNGELTANGCSVHVNSNHATDALSGANNGAVSAATICATGGYNNKPVYSPRPESCAARADPLAAVAAPVVGACDEAAKVTISGSDSATLSPGVYCGGINIATSGTVTLDPGLYIIKDGVFSVSSQATVIGDGVSIYLVGSSEVDITGGATVSLKASRTGPLAGILFFGDRNLPKTSTIKFAGGGTLHYEGTIYFPSSDIKLTGGASVVAPSPYSVFIADTYSFNGNGTFVVNSDFGASDVPPPPGLSGSAARLVM